MLAVFEGKLGFVCAFMKGYWPATKRMCIYYQNQLNNYNGTEFLTFKL